MIKGFNDEDSWIPLLDERVSELLRRMTAEMHTPSRRLARCVTVVLREGIGQCQARITVLPHDWVWITGQLRACGFDFPGGSNGT